MHRQACTKGECACSPLEGVVISRAARPQAGWLTLPLQAGGVRLALPRARPSLPLMGCRYACSGPRLLLLGLLWVLWEQQGLALQGGRVWPPALAGGLGESRGPRGTLLSLLPKRGLQWPGVRMQGRARLLQGSSRRPHIPLPYHPWRLLLWLLVLVVLARRGLERQLLHLIASPWFRHLLHFKPALVQRFRPSKRTLRLLSWRQVALYLWRQTCTCSDARSGG